jgi:hypothetical protein
VLLEHRMALELKSMGMIDRIFPLFIGESIDEFSTPPIYGSYKGPTIQPDVYVEEVERALCEHLENQGLGSPLIPNRSILSVYKEIASNQGFFIKGDGDQAFSLAIEKICHMVADIEKERSQQTVTVSSANQAESINAPRTDVSDDKQMIIAKQTQQQLRALKLQLAETEAINALLRVELAEAEKHADSILRFKIICPGLCLPIRKEPSISEPPYDRIKNGEEIVVYMQLVHGFHRLVDGRVIDLSR